MSVLVVCDEPICEMGIQAVLSRSAGFKVAGVCATLAELSAVAEQNKPNLILYSSALDPGLVQLAAVRRLAPQSAIVLWGREFSAELARHALDQGVNGFLSTTANSETIAECLQIAATGEMWMERSLSNTLLNSRPIPLSRRQTQLLALLVQGLKNREIAAALGISEGTVKAYLTTLFEKVGARDRFELALFGLKNLRNVRAAEAGRDERIRGQIRPKAQRGASRTVA